MSQEQSKRSPAEKRRKRFLKALRRTGTSVYIPERWEDVPRVPVEAHDSIFVEILRKHGFAPESPVPLVARYSKPRAWSAEELEACVNAHKQGISIALMSAALNRNPQDIIFRLLDECADGENEFREVGLRSEQKWNKETVSVGQELFAAGLTAWRIAAFLGIDFEGAEKALYQGRHDYGHKKKNPFGICTDHKQLVNQAALKHSILPRTVLDAFAGEGRFAKTVHELSPRAEITCIEKDTQTFHRAKHSQQWPATINWIEADNITVLEGLRSQNQRFDLIDLDPFVTCREQLDRVWGLLARKANLFITFGGEYRRSFIRTNRKAIAARYGFCNEALSNGEYLEQVPAFFFGWVAKTAATHGFVIQPKIAIRYPNNCRFWTEVRLATTGEIRNWYESKVDESVNGFRWRDLWIPRFSEVRYRTEELLEKGMYARMNSNRQASAALQMGLPL